MDWYSEDNDRISRALSRDFEREPAYGRDRHRPRLNLRHRFAGVLQPPVKIGGRP